MHVLKGPRVLGDAIISYLEVSFGCRPTRRDTALARSHLMCLRPLDTVRRNGNARRPMTMSGRRSAGTWKVQWSQTASGSCSGERSGCCPLPRTGLLRGPIRNRLYRTFATLPACSRKPPENQRPPPSERLFIPEPGCRVSSTCWRVKFFDKIYAAYANSDHRTQANVVGPRSLHDSIVS